eukprot:gene1570-4718_t
MATRERAMQLPVAFKGRRKPLKDILRQKCRDELRRRRQNTIDSRRDYDHAGTVHDVVENARRWWSSHGSSADHRSSLNGEQLFMKEYYEGLDDLEQAEDLWDVIAQELMLEEARLSLEFDDAEAAFAEEEMGLEDAAILQTIADAGNDQVVCPVCMRAWLKKTRCLIWCSCGLQINLQADSISLYDFGAMIHRVIDAHSLCPGALVFKPFPLSSNSGVSMLACECAVCKAYEIL